MLSICLPARSLVVSAMEHELDNFEILVITGKDNGVAILFITEINSTYFKVRMLLKISNESCITFSDYKFTV